MHLYDVLHGLAAIDKSPFANIAAHQAFTSRNSATIGDSYMASSLAFHFCKQVVLQKLDMMLKRSRLQHLQIFWKCWLPTCITCRPPLLAVL
jgi:hypothetical protein